ncbi:MAG: LysR substrate-binding domain-containing protein, partial [Myxococcota bacterium]
TASGLSPTPAGEALRPHAEAAEHALHAGRAALRTFDAGPIAPVRVALPADMVELVLLPGLAAFADAHPAVELVFDQRPGLANLMRREADIAIRSVRPTDGEELLSMRLRPIQSAVFGRPSYLEAHPSLSPADHRWIGWTQDRSHLPDMAWLAEVAPQAKFALRTTDGRTLRHAATAGVGLALLPRVFGRVTPQLREVTLDGPPPPVADLWLVTHRALRHAPGVAELWTWLSDRLRPTHADETAWLRAQLAEAYGRSE